MKTNNLSFCILLTFALLFQISLQQCSVQGCKSCNQQNQCLQCLNALEKPNFAKNICMTCNINDCLYCNTNNICTQCIGTLVPSNNGKSCVECSSDCLGCDQQSNCLQCVNPSFEVDLSGKLCILKVKKIQMFALLVGFVIPALLLLIILLFFYFTSAKRISQNIEEPQQQKISYSKIFKKISDEQKDVCYV